MESLCRAMDELTTAGADSESQLNAVLAALDKEDLDKDAACQKLIEGGILSKLKQLLANSAVNHCLVAKTIAEIAKIESCRVPCAEADVIPPLLALMEDSDIASVTQACRALGNICFDNDSGREVVLNLDGVERLLGVLRRLLPLTVDGASRARMVACGFLLNLCNTHASIQEKAVTAGALDVLQNYLAECNDDETVCQFALLCLGCLAESESGQAKLEELSVAVTVAKLLKTDVGTELQENIFELLSNMAEQDSIKAQLSSSEVVDVLLSLVSTGQEQDTVKLAADLIVLLLTGDSSMEILYNNAQGVVYKEALKWLTSPNPHLQMSGALAIGNFARSDGQCVSLVESGATEELLALLRLEDANPTLLHAAFSALRNLAIPDCNKPVMLSHGLLAAVLPHIGVSLAPVQFKMLGTLRMVLNKQAAACSRLGTDAAFMSRLCEWCEEEEHAGVKGEATRLAACVVKTSRSKEVMKQVLQSGCIKHVIGMVTSEHAVMQNEALLALVLMADDILSDLSSDLLQLELLPALKVALTDEEVKPEVICNILTLCCTLARSDEVKSLLKLADFSKLATDFSQHTDSNIKTGAKTLISLVGNE